MNTDFRVRLCSKLLQNYGNRGKTRIKKEKNKDFGIDYLTKTLYYINVWQSAI